LFNNININILNINTNINILQIQTEKKKNISKLRNINVHNNVIYLTNCVFELWIYSDRLGSPKKQPD